MSNDIERDIPKLTFEVYGPDHPQYLKMAKAPLLSDTDGSLRAARTEAWLLVVLLAAFVTGCVCVIGGAV